MSAEPIDRFRGRFHFLSNFYVSDTEINGLLWSTVEHFFQAEKMVDQEDWELIRQVATPAEAKKLGRLLPCWPDWDTRRDRIMLTGLRAKFAQPFFREELLATGDRPLIEGNTWNDTYWGVDLRTGKGHNRLGQLLMQVRTELRSPPCLSTTSSSIT